MHTKEIRDNIAGLRYVVTVAVYGFDRMPATAPSGKVWDAVFHAVS